MSPTNEHQFHDEEEFECIPGITMENINNIVDNLISGNDVSINSFMEGKNIDFDNLPGGKAGLDILLSQSNLAALDRAALLPPYADLNHPPLNKSMSQMTFSERSRHYLNKTYEEYQNAVRFVESVFQKIAKGKQIPSNSLGNVVDTFIDMYARDKNLLCNFANYDHGQEEYLYQHSVNTAIISIIIGASLGYSRGEVEQIGLAGLLADIGMMRIPESIRSKPRKFDSLEFYEVQKHTILGLDLLKDLNNVGELAACACYQHHERLSGSGYPKNSNKMNIHNYSKIIAIADVFDALTSRRSHREALHPSSAIEQIYKMAKLELLDLEIVKKVLALLSFYPVGSLVQLSNGRVARVIAPNESAIKRPVVSIISANKGKVLPRNEMYQIDLKQNKTMSIQHPVGYDVYSFSCLDGF